MIVSIVSPSFLIHQQAHSVWIPAARICGINFPKILKYICISSLATDVILLLIMLAGLLRIRIHHGAFLDLTNTLWKQVGHYSYWL